MKRSTIILTLTILLALSGVTANASLIGDDVFVYSTVQGTDISARPTFGRFDSTVDGFVPVVVGGPEVTYTAFDTVTEFEDVDVAIDIEAEDVWMTLTVNSDQSDLSFVLFMKDLNWVGMPNGELLSISVDDSNLQGFQQTFSGTDTTAFQINYASTGPINAGVYSVHVGLITNHPSTVIPEPATMTLMGLGLAGMALRRRKMKA